MPYSFIEIERQKNWVITLVFIFLVLLYFLIAEALWLIIKLFFLLETNSFEVQPIFFLKEATFVFLISLIIAVFHWNLSTKDMLNRILNLLDAVEPDPKDTYHQVFKNIVEEVSVATGGKQIRCYVIPAAGLNAFAISDFKGDAIIGITEGLLAKLNRSQLEGVIGHEAAHIASGDSLLTTITSSLFGIYSGLLEVVKRGISQTRRAGRGTIFLLFIFIVLSISQFINLILNMFLSRQKEHRADAVSVRLTRNPLSLAEALYIISRSWRGVGQIPDSLAPIFIMSPYYNRLEESEGLFSNLFSTHPPTELRLKILLDMAHSDISTLKEGTKEKQKILVEEGLIEIKEGPKKEWLVYKENNWQGPFSLEELLKVGLEPNSWVSKLDENFIKRASEDEVLNNALKDRLAVHLVEGGFLCPHCKQPLGEMLYEGVPVFKCHFCGGVFVSRDVIPRIIIREDFTFGPQVAKLADIVLKTHNKGIKAKSFKVRFNIDCPKCKQKMVRGFFSYGYPIEADKCQSCQYVWFDKDELETLQYLSERFKL